LLAAIASLIALDNAAPSDTPILNARFATLAVVIAAGLVIAHLQLRSQSDGAPSKSVAQLMLWLVTPLLGYAVALEAHRFVVGDNAAWFVIAALWALIALGLCWYAARKALPATRFLAALVFAASTVTALARLATGGLPETWPIFANLRFLALAVIGASMTLGALFRRDEEAPGDPIPRDITLVPGVLMLALAPSVETYAGVSLAASAQPIASGLLAASAVWAFASLLVVAIGARRPLPALRAVGLLMTVGAVMLTIIASELPDRTLWPPFINLRVLAFAACIAAFAGESRILRSAADGTSRIAPVLAVSAALLALWPLTKEVFVTFARSEYPSPQTWRNAGQVAVSITWGVYAALNLAWGMTRRVRVARWLGLVVLAAAVLKLFIWDLSFLEQLYRIISFGVLGLVLVGVAWAYSRYGDRLRELT